ncbi:SelT-like protein [Ananas comosus]|uniref:SelT-like protein n=1 Tax=Ananas comosus TaxID=4615 RepID=A0A199W3J8_ANACO|nr:SelT-like protein [Ananas comosus]
MDRLQLLLLGLPLYLFFSDAVNLFTPRPPPPPKPSAGRHHHHHHHPHPTPPHPHQHPSSSSSAAASSPSLLQSPSDLPSPHQIGVGAVGYGTTVELKFCASCSYRGTAMTMKKMLEASFPGIDVILTNYPPPLPKRLLGKLVPVLQMGAIGVIVAGDQIFPRLGMAPPA